MSTTALQEADAVSHPVETQWHYKWMTKHGFVSVNKTGTGLVRSYTYKKGDHTIIVSTGFNADHWEDRTNGRFGYWSTLDSHLESLTKVPNAT